MLSINTNVTSQIAQNNLQGSQSALQTSLQRLSSGLRINSAKDDAAGLAISSRMSSQISGLNQAVRNANDGISLSQTAESGMANINDGLQRMRQLAVQAANGTNSSSDRASIQQEVGQIQQEINRIGNNTQFNGQNILDGSLSNAQFQVGANANQTINFGIGDARASAIGNNSLTAAQDGTAMGVAASTSGVAANGVAAGTVTVSGNGVTATGVAYASGASAASIAAAVNQSTSTTGVSASASNSATLQVNTAGQISFTLQGSNATAVNISANVANTSDLSALAGAINAQTGTTGIAATLSGNGKLGFTNSDGSDIKLGNYNGAGATDTLTGSHAGTATLTAAANADVAGTVSYSSAGAFTVTAGGTAVAGGAATSSLSDVAHVDVTTMTNGVPTGANNALKVIDGAINMINNAQASMGAVQNRFTSTIGNLQASSTNISAARSRIQDTDFAAETANMTRNQILQQAGTAMLAQANALPNSVLSLLK